MFTHGRHFQGAFCPAKQPSCCHANKIRSHPCPGFVVQHVKLRKWFLYPEEKTQVLVFVARKKKKDKNVVFWEVRPAVCYTGTNVSEELIACIFRMEKAYFVATYSRRMQKT
jgi:hypothetical protein